MTSISIISQKPRIIRWPEVHRITGICRSHAHALAAENKFPKPIKICGNRASGWVEQEVYDWVEEKIAESRKAIPK